MQCAYIEAEGESEIKTNLIFVSRYFVCPKMLHLYFFEKYFCAKIDLISEIICSLTQLIRHSRFGGTYIVRNMKATGENQMICHKPYQKIETLEFGHNKVNFAKSISNA